MKEIYVVQVRGSGDRHDYERYHAKRNIGWFDTFENAEVALKANPSVFSDDGYYQVALIERVPGGSYACGFDDNDEPAVKWYKLEGNTDMRHFDAHYVEAPELYQANVIGYTMG